jgi:hypothetical protein|tara:strand:+ start:8 stop:298 length:291 start_codon:yes stop_codon:yes gene_type:complete
MKMRKIEQLMKDAIANKQDFKLDNTAVYFNERTNQSLVRLHNNLIAVIHHGEFKEVEVNESMFKEYPTRTTSSRLRALGVPASLKNGLALLNGVTL